MQGRDLLERFRPSASPGAVSRVGVPRDVPEDVEALAVLAVLDPVLAEAESIREQTRRTVRALEEQTALSVEEIRDRVRLEAVEARAEAVGRARDAGRAEGERLLAEATAQVHDLLARGERDLPAVVDRVIATLRRPAEQGQTEAGRSRGGGP